MKKSMIGLFIGMSVITLVGCSESKIIFEGKETTRDYAEERIEDKLEAENPHADYEVNIVDEKKKKKKKIK